MKAAVAVTMLMASFAIHAADPPEDQAEREKRWKDLSQQVFGDKKLESIREGIKLRAQAASRMGLPDALEIGQALLERICQLPMVVQAQIAGSLRRRRETIGDVDLIVALKSAGATPSLSTTRGFFMA